LVKAVGQGSGSSPLVKAVATILLLLGARQTS